jgi:hypothetical protein
MTLNFGNILISNDINPHIVSILDWQNTSIGPLYLQLCEPQFFEHIDECESVFKRDYVKNQSPEDYDIAVKLALEVDELRPLYLESIAKRCPYIAEARSVPYAELQKILMRASARSWTMKNKILTLRNGYYISGQNGEVMDLRVDGHSRFPLRK